MTPALIRCLLAISALSEVCPSVASKDVAQLLGLKRPTIHRALEAMRTKGLILKEPYGDIYLTETGVALAHRLEEQRDQLSILFVRKFSLAPDEATRASILLISELKEESLSKLQALK